MAAQRESQCRPCSNATKNKWRQSPEVKAKIKQKQKEARLKKDFGLTVSQYEAMAKEQDFTCAICKLPDRQGLCIDHDHTTNEIRGLLCHNCNLGLGNFRDNPEYFHRAIAYLETSRLIAKEK